MTVTLNEWIQDSLPLLLSKKMKRIEGDCAEGFVTAYWAGTIIRIDIKPEVDIVKGFGV